MPDKQKNIEADFLGELQPLQGKRFRAEMDRRQINVRWLGGSFLTGLASVFLMGGALYAALDGQQNLAIPAQAYQKQPEAKAPILTAGRGSRPGLRANQTETKEPDSLMMVPTVSREGDQDVVKLKPFINLSMNLAAIPKRKASYPKFDALAIFSESGKAEPIAASADLIYGADVEGEISLKIDDFPFGDPKISLIQRQSTQDIEQIVRNTAPTLNIGAPALTAITYFDPTRFSSQDSSFPATPGVTITAENVSTLSRSYKDEYHGTRYDDRFDRVKSDLPIALVLEGEGLPKSEAIAFANAIASNLASDNFLGDDQLRLTFEIDPKFETQSEKLVRVSVYRGGNHLVSVIRKDNGNLAFAREPDPVPQLKPSVKAEPLLAASKLPNVYDAIYRASINNGMTPDLAGKLVRIFAFDVDFRSAITIHDKLDVLLALPNDTTVPTDEAEILQASIKLGEVTRKYYRYRDQEDGVVDYYDETGKSAKQFLLRKPVPNGRLRSVFGMRRHPITGVRKMHWGVDYAAPRGTPILAAGNGVVEKANRAGGSGNRTILRHANGYETYYLHQTSFAKGIKPGKRVRQGQVIGYVGSTGLSTGPHLHFEVHVNGNRVNPLKIKLPSGKVLRGKELLAFEAERDRIDTLLRKRKEQEQKIARN